MFVATSTALGVCTPYCHFVSIDHLKCILSDCPVKTEGLAGKRRGLRDVGTKQGTTKEVPQEMNWEECFQEHNVAARGVLQLLSYLHNKIQSYMIIIFLIACATETFEGEKNGQKTQTEEQERGIKSVML